jgi:hypothetical protein
MFFVSREASLRVNPCDTQSGLRLLNVDAASSVKAARGTLGDRRMYSRHIAAVWTAVLVLGGCNQNVVHEAGSLTPAVRDACARPEMSAAIVSLLNAKVGTPEGPPTLVSGTQMITTENGTIDGPTLTCRGYLQTPKGQIGPGNVAVRVGYGSPSVAEDAKWLSEEDERRAERALRNPVRYDFSSAPKASVNRPPKWVLRSTDNGLSNYVDMDNISRNKNVVTIWHLQNSTTPLGIPDQNQFRSVKYQLEFNCATHQDRVLYYASFSEEWGRGKLVNGGKKAEDWKQVADGEEDDRRYACDIIY